MNNLPYIKSPRQKRILEALLCHEKIAVRDLGPMVGALNPRHHIMELRRQGFADDICTRRYVVLDRDGNTCRPGEYYIPDQYRPRVEEALKKHAAIAKNSAKAARNSCANLSRGDC